MINNFVNKDCILLHNDIIMFLSMKFFKKYESFLQNLINEKKILQQIIIIRYKNTPVKLSRIIVKFSVPFVYVPYIFSVHCVHLVIGFWNILSSSIYTLSVHRISHKGRGQFSVAYFGWKIRGKSGHNNSIELN